jgi:molecular chaperone DnaK (HSP70)
VYQGDDEDALKNILVGDFRVEGLTPMEDLNEILCRMRLDLDGILEVAAVEKLTGKSKHIRIANALREKSAEEIAAGRKRIQELYATRDEMADDEWETTEDPDEEVVDAGAQVIEISAPVHSKGNAEVEGLVERSQGLLARMHAEDREEAIGLHEQIASAQASGDAAALKDATAQLKELLFFVEGQN